jgi:hypothetical protein
MLYIVREGFEGTWHSRYAVYHRENNWARQSLSDQMQFPYESGGLITTPEAAYIRARDGRLFLIGANTVQILQAPGRCEAIAQTSRGKLLASFVGRGVFQLDHGRWDLKAAYPYGPQEGEHWAFLAESNGQIAYATTSIAQSRGGKSFYSGSAALWVLRRGTLERVPLN